MLLVVSAAAIADRRATSDERGHWRFVTAGSDFTCAELYAEVPKAVARDLGVDCRRA